jgi:outer membrane protein assembly factor BamB
VNGVLGGTRWNRRKPKGTLLTVAATMLALAALATVSCGGGAVDTSLSTTSSLPTSTTLAPGVGDWPTYHHDMARSGVASDDGVPPGAGSVGQVKKDWTSPELDGEYIYAQPLVVGGRVLVATEGNSVFALNVDSGAIEWQVNLGTPVDGSTLPCGNINPSGITGTPVVDPETGTIFVVAFLSDGPHHELFALDLATGAVRWHRAIDPPGLSATVEQERGALALSGGKVYVPFGGMAGDCGNYKGAVVAVPADGTGEAISYVVPTTRMGGIWNPTGLVVDERGDIWLATGNTASRSKFDYGNAVIHLSPQLEVLDYFAPKNWADLNRKDLDLCTTGPVLLDGGRVFIAGKTGNAYLLDAADLGHVSSALAITYLGSMAFGTAVALDSRVFVPCVGALVAVDVANDRLSIAWSAPGRVSAPIIAAGHVWALERDGLLKAVDPADGSVAYTLQIAKPPTQFLTLSAAYGRVFVADGKRILALRVR